MKNLTRRAFGTFLVATAGASLVASSAQAAGHAKNHLVTIKGFSFSPANLTVGVGDTVTFVNADNAPHTATATNKSFDTGRLGKGGESALKFSTAGKFAYFCKFHPAMKGSITVEG